MIRVRAGVSTSQVASLGSTQNQPDPVRLQDGRPTADCEKPRVESNQAQVDCGRIQLRLKNTNAIGDGDLQIGYGPWCFADRRWARGVSY